MRILSVFAVLITLCPLPGIGADVYVVPFSHLDLFWAGTREECLSRGNRIIDKAIQLAEQQPEFRFLIEDEVFVANYVETHRGLRELEQLKSLVKSGRFEIAPKWAGILQNLPRGEAHVRNQIYGKRYAREVFQVDPKVAHLGDLPGYTSQFPQILAKSGTPYMAMTRMGPPDQSLFRWRSPDGSTALVWNAVKGYGWGVGLGLHRDMDDARIQNAAKSIGQVEETTKGPIFLGWGTDLFSPSEKLVENVALLNQRLAPTRFHMATPDEFFRAAAKAPGIPNIAGEIPSSWANIISSMSHLWPPVMPAADTLISAEKVAAINHALGYADYPQKQFESLWKTLLEAMDHNNFGQGGEIGDNRKIAYGQMVVQGSGQILRDMLRNIAERVRIPIARSSPVVVFNPMSWKRDDVVRAHVSLYGDVSPGDIADYRKALRLVDEVGASIPFYVEGYSGTVSRAVEIAFIARGVPPVGYKTYFVVPAESPEGTSDASELKLYADDPKNPKRIFGSDQLDNRYYRVTIDRGTGRITVFDKELNRNILKDAEIAASEERGGDTLSVERATGRMIFNTIDRVQLEENNPARTVVRIEGGLAGVPVTQKLTLYRDLKKIDIENSVEWKQNRFMKIEQVFPYDHAGANIRYGVPFGSVAGEDILPNSGPHFGDEIPRDIWKQWRQIQDWIFAGGSDGGVTISADRQLMTLTDGAIRAGMMRGSYSPIGIVRAGAPYLHQFPPAGRYVFRYSLTSGKGDWSTAKSYRAGMEFSNPLIPVSVANELSPKQLPPTHSFFSLDAENVVLSAIKKSEFDDSLVVRLYEMQGQQAQSRVRLLGRDRQFEVVNLLEENPGSGQQETLRLNPFEIGTVRLRIGKE